MLNRVRGLEGEFRITKFILGLSPEIQKDVEARNPATFEEAVKHALDYERLKKPIGKNEVNFIYTPRRGRCFKCGYFGHYANTCRLNDPIEQESNAIQKPHNPGSNRVSFNEKRNRREDNRRFYRRHFTNPNRRYSRHYRPWRRNLGQSKQGKVQAS
jgi:hypothetical protein